MIKHKKILDSITISALVFVLLFYFTAVYISGGSVFYAIKYIFSIILTISLGTTIAMKLIKNKDLGFYIIAGFPLGIVAIFLSFLAFGSAYFALIFGLAGLRNIDFKKLFTLKNKKIEANILILTFCLFLVFYVFMGVLSFATASKTGTFLYHQDMLWSVGNAASVFNGFPLEDMRLANTSLNYHFLNDALAGVLAVSADVTAYEALCFYYYPTIMAMFIFALYYITYIVSENSFLASFAPFTLMFVASAKSELMFNYIVNMNGQGSASLALISFLVIFNYAVSKRIDVKNILLVFISSIVMIMFKSTIGTLAVLSVLSASIVYKILNKDNFNKIIYSLIGAVAFLICNFLVFSKAINNLVFIGFGEINSFLDVFINSPVISLIFFVNAFYFLPKLKSLSFLQLTCYAGGVGGSVAYTLYKHYSFSQIYFLLIAICFMVMIIPKAIGCIKWNKGLIAVFSLVVVCFFINTVDVLAIYSSNGIRAAMNIFDIVDDPYDESYITAYDEEAMIWLRENTSQDAIFITNRNNKFLASGDGIFHYYTAVSQRRAYIESYRYTMDYSGMYDEVVRRLEDVSDEIFYKLSEEEAFVLAKKEGIDYLVVNNRISQINFSKTPVFENEEIKIYFVN